MYERPQYTTPDGYRRLRKRPDKKALQKAGAQKARNDVVAAKLKLQKMSAGAQRGISKEAAKLIAVAIRSMLQQR